MHDQAETVNILSAIADLQSAQEYQELNWEGSLEDYLKLVQENPRVTRNAFQRIYDMILSHGVEEYVEHKKKITRYRFFRDYAPQRARRGLRNRSEPQPPGRYLQIRLPQLRHGTARDSVARPRRQRKKHDRASAEEGSRRILPQARRRDVHVHVDNIANDVEKEVFALVNDELPCPMREEPLHLIPADQRGKLIEELMRNSAIRSSRSRSKAISAPPAARCTAN